MQQVHGLAQVECPAAVHCGRGHSSAVVALRATAHQRGHFDFRKAAVGGLPLGIQGGDLSVIHFRELPAECLRETRAVLVLVGVPPPILIPAVKNAAAVFFGQMVHHELGEPNRPLGIFRHMERHPRLGCPIRRLKLRRRADIGRELMPDHPVHQLVEAPPVPSPQCRRIKFAVRRSRQKTLFIDPDLTGIHRKTDRIAAKALEPLRVGIGQRPGLHRGPGQADVQLIDPENHFLNRREFLGTGDFRSGDGNGHESGQQGKNQWDGFHRVCLLLGFLKLDGIQVRVPHHEAEAHGFSSELREAWSSAPSHHMADFIAGERVTILEFKTRDRHALRVL